MIVRTIKFSLLNRLLLTLWVTLVFNLETKSEEFKSDVSGSNATASILPNSDIPLKDSSLLTNERRMAIYYDSQSDEFSTEPLPSDFPHALKSAIEVSFPDLTTEIIDINNKYAFEINQYLAENSTYAITVGEKVFLKILSSRSSVPIFSLKTPEITLSRMQKIYRSMGYSLSGIYREQPFTRQLKLLKQVDESLKNAYLLLGIMTRYSYQKYEKETVSAGYNYFYKILKNQNSSAAYFTTFHPENGALFLLDNPQQFDEKSVQMLLPVSHQFKVPMIGNRLEHGHLGALATVYSANDDLIEATILAMKEYFQTGILAKKDYLKQVSVMINQPVANHFGYTELNEISLANFIMKAK